MNWEELFNALKGMLNEDGTAPEEFGAQVVVASGDGDLSIDLTQSLNSGKLIFVPLCED